MPTSHPQVQTDVVSGEPLHITWRRRCSGTSGKTMTWRLCLLGDSARGDVEMNLKSLGKKLFASQRSPSPTYIYLVPPWMRTIGAWGNTQPWYIYRQRPGSATNFVISPQQILNIHVNEEI